MLIVFRFVRYLTLNKQAGSVDAMRQLDDLLIQLAGSVNTDLLPGSLSTVAIKISKKFELSL